MRRKDIQLEPGMTIGGKILLEKTLYLGVERWKIQYVCCGKISHIVDRTLIYDLINNKDRKCPECACPNITVQRHRNRSKKGRISVSRRKSRVLKAIRENCKICKFEMIPCRTCDWKIVRLLLNLPKYLPLYEQEYFNEQNANITKDHCTESYEEVEESKDEECESVTCEPVVQNEAGEG